jgi:hypothetical protein
VPEFARDSLQLHRHRRGAVDKVYVVPAQSECLTAPHTERDGYRK